MIAHPTAGPRARQRVLLVDNVDSFSFMLADLLRVAGADVRVVRNNAIGIDEALAGHDGIVISPGPGHPRDAGISLALAAAAIERRLPLFGVCLGHQAIALACGGTVARVAPMHGKVAMVAHDGSGLFAALPSPFAATRYHSLAVLAPGAGLVANAWSADGIVMGLRHSSAPAHGVQFHPESVATAHGLGLAAAFVATCAAKA